MRSYLLGPVIIITMAIAASCAPRQIKPVASIDPAPLLEAVGRRQAALEKGLSGKLELVFKNGRQRFNGTAYIVAYPDGRFRLEVPAPLGGTHMVMTNDNKDILAFYPGENRAFRSSVNGRSINPHLPFPLPVDPSILPALIMGVFPSGTTVSNAEAHLMDSGEMLLLTGPVGSGLRYSWLFGEEQSFSLRRVDIEGRGVNVSMRTRNRKDDLPGDFDLTLAEGVLRGEWDSVAIFTGDKGALQIQLPGHVPVTDLETAP